MHRLLLLVIACCLPALPSIAQGPLDSLINSFGASFTTQPSHNGVSIGVYADGKTYYFNYGTVKRGIPMPPNNSTIYEIGSVTKTFTAYLLAQAVTEDKLHLQDNVRKYLDGTYPNLAYQGHPITIENLANHTAGLPKFLPRLDPMQTPDQILAMYPDISGAQLLSELSRFTPDTLPGTKFIYSNADAQLIGLILEKVDGQSYAELVRHYITGPLGMTKEPPVGYRELLHGGGSFGTTSLCLLVPQHRIGVICLANDAAPETEHTLTLLSEAIAKTLISAKSL